MKDLSNGYCDIFPLCQKVIQGLGCEVIATCDGCIHWHEMPKDGTK